MSYTIDPVLVGGELLYGLYTGDGWLVKEFYNFHTAELAAFHLDAISDEPPGGPEPPGDDIPGPGEPLPPPCH